METHLYGDKVVDCLHFVAMREASLGTGQERHYESLDNDMFSGIQAFWIADRGRTAYSVYPAAGNERFL